MGASIILAVTIGIVLIILYLVYDLATSTLNAFLDKWVGKTVWIWLPFHGFSRLIKEVILKKK